MPLYRETDVNFWRLRNKEPRWGTMKVELGRKPENFWWWEKRGSIKIQHDLVFKPVCRVLVVCAILNFLSSNAVRSILSIQRDRTPFDTLNCVLMNCEIVIVKCAKGVDIWRRRRLAAEMHYIWIRPSGTERMGSGIGQISYLARKR